MGNCVQSGGGDQGVLMQPQRRRRGCGGGKEEEEEEAAAGGDLQQQAAAAACSSATPVVKVKMVLTKGELGWLVARLKAGDRRLDDVLQEMARNREGRAAGGGDGWRPSLESIIEETASSAAAAAAASFDN